MVVTAVVCIYNVIVLNVCDYISRRIFIVCVSLKGRQINVRLRVDEKSVLVYVFMGNYAVLTTKLTVYSYTCIVHKQILMYNIIIIIVHMWT